MLFDAEQLYRIQRYGYVFEVTTICGQTNDPCFLILQKVYTIYYNVPNYKHCMIGGQCVKNDNSCLPNIDYSYIYHYNIVDAFYVQM